MSATLPTSSASLGSSARPRLEYLDGLRGLAALYVVIYHVVYHLQTSDLMQRMPGWLVHVMGLLNFGRASVDVFIVLSGYCLMLPVASSPALELRGGMVAFIKRRARRILPPYYAALILTLLGVVFLPGLRVAANPAWTTAMPALTPGAIISHLFLVHNLYDAWAYKIDYPMWSIGTEWQIYFLFPLFLLPLLKRARMGALLVGSFAVGLSTHFLFHGLLDTASFHYVGLFALGMIGAMLGFAQNPAYERWRRVIPWGGISAALLIPIAILAKMRAHTDWLLLTGTDILIGAAALCLIVFCTRCLTERQCSLPLVLRCLEARPCVVLGTFSYSLYLVHAPVLALVFLPLWQQHVLGATTLLIMLFGAIPLVVIVSYLFHLAFERPFMGTPPPRTERQAEVAAITSPAP